MTEQNDNTLTPTPTPTLNPEELEALALDQAAAQLFNKTSLTDEAKANLGQGGFEDPTLAPTNDEDEEEEVEEEQPPPLPPTETPPAIPQSIKIGEQELPTEELLQLWQFRQSLASNPELAQRVRDAVIGQQPTSPFQPQPPSSQPQSPSQPSFQLPPELDTDDPTVKFMLEQFTQLQNQLQVAQDAARQSYQTMMENQTTLGVETWKSSHSELTEPEIGKVLQKCYDLGLYNAYLSQRNTVTGQQLHTPSQAIQHALNDAMRLTPDVYDRVLANAATQANEQAEKDRKRQAKLGALGGTSGNTTSRVPNEPTTPQDRDRAMVDEIRAAMGIES